MLKAPKDPAIFRQSLLQFLETHPPHEEDLLKELEAQRESGQPIYSALIHILTHLNFYEAEARRHWQQILAHREALRARLGRDVGLRVAMLDYFVNLNQALKNPKVIEISIYERTERSAVTDGLTGLFNHAYLLQALRREVQRSKRHDFKVSLALFDLDNFKKINDTRGHLEGDRVLVKTAALLQESLREMDIAARYGGEEFAVILPDTSRTGGYVVADRIRRRIEEHFRRRKGGVNVTISGGVATYPEDATNHEELIQRADEGLYRSKADGKNRITLVEGERRRHIRVPVSHRVTLNGLAGRKAPARAKNISESGLLVSLKKPVEVGSNVSLVIRPTKGASMGVRGEVVRVERAEGKERYDVGVRLHEDQAGALLVLRRPAQA
jgi:diguanylate cyclase (GGDEF)-like protein